MVRCVKCGRENSRSQVVWLGMVMPVCNWCFNGHAPIEHEKVPATVDALDALLSIYIAQAMLDEESKSGVSGGD